MRKSTLFFLFVALNLLIIAVLYFHSDAAIRKNRQIENSLGEIVKNLKLTDAAMSTDARYTRHPSQADLFSPFQDYPCSIEHFPTGSVIPPPEFESVTTEIKIK